MAGAVVPFLISANRFGRQVEAFKSLSRAERVRLAPVSALLVIRTYLLIFQFFWRLVLFPIAVVALALTLRLSNGRPSRFLVEVVGDVQAIIDSQDGRTLMAARIQRDFEWSKQRASRVVVVAHSQGAMLSRRVLGRAGTASTEFITLGAGIGVLESLLAFRSGRIRDLRRLVAAIGAVPFLQILSIALNPAYSRILTRSAICAASGAENHSCPGLLINALAPIGAGILVLASLAFFFATASLLQQYISSSGYADLWASRTEELSLPRNRVRTWTDLSSQRDAVSLGNLLDGIADETFTVFNSLNTLKEHGSYVRNTLFLAVLSRIAGNGYPATRSVIDVQAEISTMLSEGRRQRLQQRLATVPVTVVVGAVLLGVLIYQIRLGFHLASPLLGALGHRFER